MKNLNTHICAGKEFDLQGQKVKIVRVIEIYRQTIKCDVVTFVTIELDGEHEGLFEMMFEISEFDLLLS